MNKREKQEQAIVQQLRIVFRAIQAHSRAVEKVCNLSSAKLWMLHEIFSSPGITVSELAKVLSIHRSTCSNMLDKIEDRGLVCRSRSKTDQRTVHLQITEEGAKLLSSAPNPPQGQLNSTLQKLPLDQLTNLEIGLENFINALHFGDEEKASQTPIPVA